MGGALTGGQNNQAPPVACQAPAADGSLRSSLCASIADGAAFSVMVGMGEAYLPAFVLAVGLGEVFAGLAATVPVLAGAILQLISPRLIRFAGTHRRWVILCATVQAASFLPLALAAIRGKIPAFAVFMIATVYWAAGMAAGPAWNTWMSRAVPRGMRPRFFAKRSRLAQVSVLAGLLAGGTLLQWVPAGGAVLWAFAVLFAGAGAARLLSAVFLARQREPRSPIQLEERLSLVAFVGRLHQPESRLLAYMLAVQVMTHLAAPFFTPFMLGELKLTYGWYMVVLATAFLAKALAMPWMGNFARRFGAKPLLWIGGLGIIPLSGLWALCADPFYLLGLQIVGGVVWACYEFATFLLLFETIRDEQRTSILTSFNLLNAAAIALGSVLGGLWLQHAGTNFGAYFALFLVSSAGRLLTLPMLLRVADMPLMPAWITFRTLAVRPSAGTIERPVLASVEMAESADESVLAASGEVADEGGRRHH